LVKLLHMVKMHIFYNKTAINRNVSVHLNYALLLKKDFKFYTVQEVFKCVVRACQVNSWLAFSLLYFFNFLAHSGGGKMTLVLITELHIGINGYLVDLHRNTHSCENEV